MINKNYLNAIEEIKKAIRIIDEYNYIIKEEDELKDELLARTQSIFTLEEFKEESNIWWIERTYEEWVIEEIWLNSYMIYKNSLKIHK